MAFKAVFLRAYLLPKGDAREGEIIETISIDQEHLQKDGICTVIPQMVPLIRKLILHLRERELERDIAWGNFLHFITFKFN